MDTSPAHMEGKIIVQKLRPQSEFPTKENSSDVGWNVTLVSRTENRAEDETGEINDFNTGIRVSPPEGYFLEAIAVKSLHRTGYMLTGPVIIESGSKGELIIPLYKFRETDDIELPFVAVRLLTRHAIYAHISHSTSDPTSYTLDRSYNSSGPYIQGASNGGYSGDMKAYGNQVKAYAPGVKRPQAAPSKQNHMY